jgi:hypothetical protein
LDVLEEAPENNSLNLEATRRDLGDKGVTDSSDSSCMTGVNTIQC